jgi:CRP/FNR family cyclic AMP-dependent transcriptional regulator
MTTAQKLSQTPLFADLTEEQLTPLAGLAREVHCAQGEYLFRQGSAATSLYLLMDGKVSIQVGLTSHPQVITVTTLSQPGQLVGWSGVVQPKDYTASAICQANSHLLTFDGQAFMHALEQDPAMGFIIMRRVANVISGRLRNIQQIVLKTL